MTNSVADTINQTISLEGTVGDLDWSTFTVHGLRRRVDLEGNLEAELDLSSTEANLDPQAVVGQQIDVVIHPLEMDDVRIREQVVQVRHERRTDSGLYWTHLVIQPAMVARTRQRRRIWFYQDISVVDAITQCLEAAGYVCGHDFDFWIQGDLLREARPRELQYRESDWDFICRLCHNWGMALFFDVDWVRKGRHKLIFSDDPRNWPKNPLNSLPYASDGSRNGIYFLEERAHQVVKTQIVQSVAYDDEFRVMSLDKKLSAGCGRTIDHLADLQAQPEAGYLARIRSEDAGGQVRSFAGISGVAPVMPGGVLTVTGHPEFGDLDLQVTGIDLAHKNVDLGQGSSRFSDSEIHFQAVILNQPVRTVCPKRRPGIHGVHHAIVLDSDGGVSGSQPVLDSAGRYRLRLMICQAGDTTDGAIQAIELPSVPMAQPHIGNGFGLHAPLPPGTEVAVGFMDGDPARPVILGALPNVDQPSPVTAANNSQDVLESYQGAEIRFDNDLDGNGAAAISLVVDRDDDESPLTYLRLGAVDGDRDVEDTLSSAIDDIRTATATDDAVSACGIAVLTDGSLAVYGAGDRYDGVAGLHLDATDGHADQQIGGSGWETVAGDTNRTVSGAATRTVNGSDGATVAVSAGSWTSTVAGDWDMTVGGDSTLTVAGDRTMTINGQSASYVTSSSSILSLKFTWSVSFSAECSLYIGLTLSISFSFAIDLKLGFALSAYIFSITVKVMPWSYKAIKAKTAADVVKSFGADIKTVATKIKSAAAWVKDHAVRVKSTEMEINS